MSAHWYDKEGNLLPEGMGLPSVTTILAIRANPGLQEWRDRVGTEEADATGLYATDRGTAVHDTVEYIIKGYEPPIIATTAQCVRGFLEWELKYKPTNMISELFLISEEHGFAGKCDLICEIDGELWIIDFKTSKHIRAEYGLQLAAYEQMYFEMTGKHARRAVLQLTDQLVRGYRFKEFTSEDDLDIFLAHQRLLVWDIANAPKQWRKNTEWVTNQAHEQTVGAPS